MKRVMQLLSGLSLLLMAVIAFAAEGGIAVENAWVREAPPGASALAGYMVVKNNGSADKVLVGAASNGFANVMLHRTIIENGTAKMIHQMAITIPAKGEVTFEPNGYHVMLVGPKKSFKAGDKVEITLTFQDGSTMPVVYEVRKAEMEKPMNHDMDGMHM